MILVHPFFINPLAIKNNKINIIVLEQQKLFTKFIAEIFSQISSGDGSCILSQDGKEIDLSKTMDIVVDVFNISVNQKKAVNKLHAVLSGIAQESEHYLVTKELLMNINVYLGTIIKEQSLPLTYNETLDVLGIFKFADVKFVEEKECLPEKLIDYMEVMREYCGLECFVFVNLKSYISTPELKAFYQDILYQGFNVILLESRMDSESNGLEEWENVAILDKDLCEF